MFKRKWWAAGLSVGLLVMLLIAVMPAFAAINVEILSVTQPTGMAGIPPYCNGDVTVTLRYASTEDIDVDYTVTVTGFPSFSGSILLTNTGGATQSTSITFNIPAFVLLAPGTPVNADIDALGVTTSISLTDAAVFLCDDGYIAPPASSGPLPVEPDVIVPPEPTDGRLDISSVHGVVYYDGDGVFSVYTLDENSNGVLAIEFTEAEKDALPDFPATNILIEQNADKTVSLYKLTTGEFQLNLGPDFEGKVKVFIFDDFPPTHVYTSEFVVGP